MKIFAVFLIVCSVAVSSHPLTEILERAAKIEVSLSQCLAGHSIDPALVLDTNVNEDEDPLDSLTEEKKSCLVACMYRAFNWLKQNGHLDLNLLVEGRPAEESEALKKKYETMIQDCWYKAEEDECKFFHCLLFEKDLSDSGVLGRFGKPMQKK